jgi:hypothetical protein
VTASKRSFDALIDPAYSSETSIVLRYRNAFTFGASDEDDACFKDTLKTTSIREGSRIFSLLRYRGVDIYTLDETSLMHTRTLKAIDGCVTTAKCKVAGLSRVALETGGNTGSALTAYGTRAGLETFCFLPDENLGLLNSAIFESPKAHLISVEDPDLVKRVVRLFEKRYGLKRIPETGWRYEASRFRGMAILEYMLRQGKFHWIAQTISAAFGPIGIYWAFNRFGKAIGALPRFLGVQQEANCPMYKSWKRKRRTLRPVKIGSTSRLLTRVMYDVKPHTYGTYKDLLHVLNDTRGMLTTINHAEFDALLERRFDGQGILELLAGHGITIRQPIVEKTGLIALAGTLKAIEAGTVRKGSRLLWCMTSGMSDADGRTRPEYRIRSLTGMLTEYGVQASLPPRC